MLNNAPLFLALRYLRPKRSFVSVITIISIFGVAVGVVAMVVIPAVMVGFEQDFRARLIGGTPHVLVAKNKEAPPDGGAVTSWQKAAELARARPETAAASPFVGGTLYMARDDRQTAALALGLDQANAGTYLRKISPHVVEGSLDLVDDGIVISDNEAHDLGVVTGDEISVYPDKNVNQAVRDYTAAEDEDDTDKKKALRDAIKLHPVTLRVTGIVDGSKGGRYCYLTLKTGQALYRLGQEVTGISVELHDPEQADSFAKQLLPGLTGWHADLWTDQNKARLAAMRNEQVMMKLVLAIIAVVAAFSVMNTTITVTMQKRREIGVLASLGGSQTQIINVFFLQAVIVGVLGTAMGLVMSWLVIWQRNELRTLLAWLMSLLPGASDRIYLPTMPAQVHGWDVAMMSGLSVLLCIVAGFIPAWLASKVEPAEALRD